jgi:rubrerythrin
MLKIDAGDVLRFAIRVEEDGELFYNRAAMVVDDKNVSDLFNELAAEEIRHKTIFEGLLSGVRHIDPPESYPGEYAAYLHDYIDGKVIFLREKKAEAAEIHTVASALDFAIHREADSILYYQELKGYVVQKEQSAIDKIIAEERSHFVRLSAMKKNYA